MNRGRSAFRNVWVQKTSSTEEGENGWMKIAEPTDWKADAMPELQTIIPLGILYNRKQLMLMKRGVIPREMEDKWFVYWENDELFFHRSWTGFCVYKVRFDCEQMGALAVDAIVNRDPDQYSNTDDDYDAKLIHYLINVLLLRRPSKFPARSSSRHKAALEQWSQVGRAGHGEYPDGEN
jgi:hypothetical protein